MQKTAQIALIYEDIYEALRADVMAAGGTKTVAAELWPAMKITEASNRINNCLNRSRPEKLDPEEVLHIKRLARKQGSLQTVRYEADDLCISQGIPLEPEDEIARLQREFNDSVKGLHALADHISKLTQQ